VVLVAGTDLEEARQRGGTDVLHGVAAAVRALGSAPMLPQRRMPEVDGGERRARHRSEHGLKECQCVRVADGRRVLRRALSAFPNGGSRLAACLQKLAHCRAAHVQRKPAAPARSNHEWTCSFGALARSAGVRSQPGTGRGLSPKRQQRPGRLERDLHARVRRNAVVLQAQPRILVLFGWRERFTGGAARVGGTRRTANRSSASMAVF
jgi:hypothetical protein